MLWILFPIAFVLYVLSWAVTLTSSSNAPYMSEDDGITDALDDLKRDDNLTPRPDPREFYDETPIL